MASLSMIATSSPPWLQSKTSQKSSIPSASFNMLGRRSSVTVNVARNNNSTIRPGLLNCSFLASSSSISFPSSVSGFSLGLDFKSNSEASMGKRRGLVVRAGKAALCQTKRNRSRKSLARTHGFRLRMRTTSGRAILKRRRAKGRWVLCTKSNPNSGKRRRV